MLSYWSIGMNIKSNFYAFNISYIESNVLKPLQRQSLFFTVPSGVFASTYSGYSYSGKLIIENMI